MLKKLMLQSFPYSRHDFTECKESEMKPAKHAAALASVLQVITLITNPN